MLIWILNLQFLEMQDSSNHEFTPSILDSYQLNLVQKTQEIFCNALKAGDRAGFQRMNDYSTFCSCKGTEFHVNIFSLFFLCELCVFARDFFGSGLSGLGSIYFVIFYRLSRLIGGFSNGQETNL